MDASFVRRLFSEGRIVLGDRPAGEGGEDATVLEVLRRAFDDYRLALAGPLIAFSAGTAQSAASFLERAAWYLVCFEETEADLEQALAFPEEPRSAAEHLSADLVFRYLPAILRRARAIDARDRLAELVADVLRRWPLSGVLADLAEAPATGLEFAGHRGLRLLYAERLAEHFKPAWVPEEKDRAYLDLVWTELDRDPRLLAVPR